jgi:hypothetical protein
VYISKEIIQRGDLAVFSPSERSQHVARALRAPTDKLAYKRHWLPSSRFLEDYWLHRSWKWARPMRVVGVSVNPEYLTGASPRLCPPPHRVCVRPPSPAARSHRCPTLTDVNWDALRRQHVHDPQFIVFLRSNLVKQALSAVTGKELKRRCGSANLRESSACATASQRPFHVAVATLADELALWSQRYRFFMRFMWHELPAVQEKVASRAVGALRPPRPTVVYYEQLQSDLGNAVSNALAAATGHHFSFEEQEQLERHLLTPSTWWAGGWRKRTSDDLSAVVENFEYLVQLLSDETHESVCSLVREMLLETRYRVFSMDAGSLTAVFNCAQRLRGVQTRLSIRDFFEGGDEDADALLRTQLAAEDAAEDAAE